MVKDNKILVNEIFESIDGEGYHAGRPTVFFRTVGCNLRCSWCDSTYTFKPEDNSKWMTVEQAIEEVEKFGWKHVTITGGEPLMEENKSWMIKFMRTLQEKGYSIDVETNGSIDLEPYISLFDELFANGKHDAMNEDRPFVTFIMDWKAPSSKMTNKMLPKNLMLLSDTDIVKVVCSNDDFNTVLNVLNSGTAAQVYISPVFNQVDMEKIPEFILKYGKEYPNLKAQIQMHKVFWDPNLRGV